MQTCSYHFTVYGGDIRWEVFFWFQSRRMQQEFLYKLRVLTALKL